MGQRASPGTLVIARDDGRNARMGLPRGTAGIAGSILVVVLAATVIGVPVAAIPVAADESLTYRVLLPAIMCNAGPAGHCLGTLPCDILVRVEDADGNPIQNARIVGLYTDSEGQTTSLSRVTDENGEAIFPGSDREIIFEVQFPVGVLPCPGSPPRVRTSPGQTFVRFVGCRI